MEATDTESGLQRSSLRGCLVLTDTRLLATGAAPVSPPPSPSSHTTIKTTKAVANEDGGGADGGSSFWARRNGSGSVDDNRRHRHTALWGLVDPTGGTVYPHRCMLPHVTLVAGRRARRRRRRSGGGDNKALFGDGGDLLFICLFCSMAWYSRGTVLCRHSQARRLRLFRRQERRHFRLRCGSGI